MNDTSNNGPQNGSVDKKSIPPEIPHITNNILPLSNVLKFYTQEAYKQITTLIENLSSTKESESDSIRKKNFLKVIISLRQDFIKIYTLVKWASNSKDVSKFIDLLNWFRMQEFHFEQLSFQLNGLNSFSGAKLPNSDLITSLEVLIKGRPQLPSYNFIKVPPISPEKTLEVLQDLNLTLMTRMALIDIPERFLNAYEIKDGRIILSIPNEFQISITVANDIVIETDEEYYKSPFYFVDFKFLFGINPESGLITHRENKITTRLPSQSHEKLEKIVNNILLTQGLNGLYDLLHKYSISFKLYLIAKQMKDLIVQSKWKGSVQFNYQNGKSLIIINYWSGQYLSRNWKSFVEVGIDRSYNLNFRWFKNGRYEKDHGIRDIFKQGQSNGDSSNSEGLLEDEDSENLDDLDDSESSDLSIDLILTIIVNKHSEMLISKIFDQFVSRLVDIEPEEVGGAAPEPGSPLAQTTTAQNQISYISPHQLLIKLSPNKSTIFSINPTTGFFYFIDPTPIQNQITKKINSIPSQAQNKPFITENDLITNVVDSLIQLRLETYNKEINNRLMTTEWINNDIIKLNDYETTKLYNFLVNSTYYTSIPNSTKIQFYRRKNWPSSWFLINLTNGIITKTHWWVSRIKSINGDWKIQWIQKLTFKGGEDSVHPKNLNFEFFSSLSKLCSNMIIDHMILEELQVRGIQFLKLDNVDQVLKKFNIDLDGKQEEPKETPKTKQEGDLFDMIMEDESNKEKTEETEAQESNGSKDEGSNDSPITYETTLLLYNNNNLLPIYNSTSSLFLKIKLINVNQQSHMELKLFGHLRNLAIKSAPESLIKIDSNRKLFEIDDLINLTNRMGAGRSEGLGSGFGPKAEPTEDLSDSSSKNLLDKIFNKLNKLNELIKILDQLNKNKIEVVTNTINDITIKIDDNLENLVIKLPEKSTDCIKLISGDSKTINGSVKEESMEVESESKIKSKDLDSHGELKVILIYLNRYLRRFHGSTSKEELASVDLKSSSSGSNETVIDSDVIETKPGPIAGIIKYLEDFNPIIKSINTIKEQFSRPENIVRLPNGLAKVNFDTKLPSLNQIQYIYHLNFLNPTSSKKIFKDKITVTLSFKTNKFDNNNRNLIKISLKDNLNSKNFKYKALFELIFKAVNEIDVECQKNSQKSTQQQVQTPSSTSSDPSSPNPQPSLIKLNYDFLVNVELIEEVMVKISSCFLVYLKTEHKKGE